MLSNAIQLGLLLGLRHASEADHVCTIASLLRAGQGRRQALATAALWGLGHSASFFAVGVALLVFDIHVSPAVEQGVGLAVAAILVGMGVSQWRHADCPAPAHAGLARGRASVMLGLLHGLAGSAGVALLALTTLQDRFAALVYLGLFGLGTVLGMVLVTLLLSWSLSFAARFEAGVRTRLIRGAAALSIGMGAWLLVSPLLS
jgi:hypothetical protein